MPTVGTCSRGLGVGTDVGTPAADGRDVVLAPACAQPCGGASPLATPLAGAHREGLSRAWPDQFPEPSPAGEETPRGEFPREFERDPEDSESESEPGLCLLQVSEGL